MPKDRKIISYTRVSADIFHYGHLKLFEKAKSAADYHICGLYTDELCVKWNGSLVMKYNEREAIINQFDLVDEIMEQNNIDPTENLKLIYNKFPDSKIILLQGHQNWVGLPGTDFIKSIGGEIIRPDYYPELSRNTIKEKLQNLTGKNNYDIDNYILGNISYFPFLNSTKANTLSSLKKQKLKHSLIENLFVFTALQWKEEKNKIIKTVQKNFVGKIIVRSSSKVEDGLSSSYAGYFHSELNVNSGDKKAVKNAIELVINSYTKHDKTSNDDQILVQSQTKGILYSGVVFTREFQNNSPYYTINYDKSSSTDTVTSGKVGRKIEIVKNIKIKDLPSPWKQLITSVKEIEDRLHNLALDIEFGIQKNNKVVIFQVRPIAANQKYSNNIDDSIYKAVQNIINKYKRLSNKSISSNSYTLSDMSFWNPAEIIGERSNTLAYSSYRYLILHRAWNIGLVPLGYKKVERDLIVSLGNKSYIEVETAFTALLPRRLNKSITGKLISYYINKLKNNPELHDKVEFEIVHNCYTPITEDQLLELKPILNDQEYRQFKGSLKILTQNIFCEYNNIKMKDLRSLDELEKRRNQIIQKNHNISLINKIILAGNLIEDAKEFGTSQFSRMARLAFIGNQYLKALVKKNVISEQDSDIYLANIDTIASELKKDFNNVLKDNLSIDEFKSIYGHLRPGTYDINKIPYEKDNSYFSVDTNSARVEAVNQKLPKEYFKNFRKSIKEFLSTYELDINVDELLCFIEETTKFREKFKFEFTKNLSIAYELLFEVGLELGLNRDSLSHLSIESILAINHQNNIEDILDYWTNQVSGKKKIDNTFNHIALPSLVLNYRDFNIVQYHTARPNYITTRVVKSNLIDLDKLELENYDKVYGEIVLLENADPGYDWIFSKNINGLITRFGGVASHMAIRCAEFNIPAAIGCGEVIYKELQSKMVIELNCKEKSIRYIK